MHLSRRAALAGALASTAMSPDQRVAVLGGAAGPALSLNFLSGLLDPRITFTRASTAWEFNSAGSLASFSSNTPRFGYDPTTLAARGLLIEEARTNSIRNNSNTGAVVGTPGTLPTNWTQNNTNGLSANVVGFGTDHGIPYIDVRLNGTTASGTSTNIVIEGATGIAAVQNQIWTSSFYLSLTAGSLTNVTSIFHNIQPLTNVGGSLTVGSTTVVPTGASLASQRNLQVYTLPNATTAFVRPFIQVFCAAAPVAVDLTLRIGGFQFELGSFATSPILTTSAAVTRAAEVASMPLVAGAAFSIAAEVEVDAPVTSSISQYSVQIDDGNTNNRVLLYRALITGNASVLMAGAGTIFINSALGVVAQGAVYKSAAAHADSVSKLVLNGGTVLTSALANVVGPSTILRLGASTTASNQLNGHLRRVNYWSRVLSNGELQAATA